MHEELGELCEISTNVVPRIVLYSVPPWDWSSWNVKLHWGDRQMKDTLRNCAGSLVTIISLSALLFASNHLFQYVMLSFDLMVSHCHICNIKYILSLFSTLFQSSYVFLSCVFSHVSIYLKLLTFFFLCNFALFLPWLFTSKKHSSHN